MASELFTLAQIETAVGGARTLVQLAKASDTSDARYAAFVAEVRAAAEGDVYSIVQVPFDIADPTVPAAVFLQQHCLAIAVYWAYSKGSGGQAMPEDVRTKYSEAIGVLREVRSGERSLGTDTEPASQLPAQRVSLDAVPGSWTRTNWGGFC